MAKLDQEYVVMDGYGKSETWKPEDFWQMAFDPDHPRNNPDLGYLVSVYHFDKDWDSWEMHPCGDELIFCISGAMSLTLDLDNEKSETLLQPGEFKIIPKKTWHTAKATVPSKALQEYKANPSLSGAKVKAKGGDADSFLSSMSVSEFLIA